MRALARRLTRIEVAAVAGTARPVPFVIYVGADETKAEAVARFAKQWPNRPPNHRTLIVPAKPRTDAEREMWANSFRDRQLALVAAARRERVETLKAAPNEPRATFPQGGTVAPPKGRAFIPWTRNA